MKINIKRLTENAVMPVKAHASDAGFDLTATSCSIDGNGSLVFRTGLAFEIPEGYVGLLFPRSSIANKNLMLANSVGVIDSGYRGEVMFKFKPIDGYATSAKHHNRASDDLSYSVGDRIGQLVIMPYPSVAFVEAGELSESERGTGGYGSSGK